MAKLYGRDRELNLLKQWIVKDRCRLVTIFGMGGIGKTTLSISCARQIQARFDSLIWRSLHYAPAAAELVNDLLQFFTTKDFHLQALPARNGEEIVSQADRVRTENLDSKISSLIEYLRRNKCLIVLDTATEIWQSGDLAGHYREQYKGYGELLQRLGEESHQSCLLLCTGEKPKEVALLEEQFERLSSLEQEIITWLAIAYQPLSLIQLHSKILLPINTAELIEALESLVRRSLIVRTIANYELLYQS